jgi:hypothetical protein
VVSEEGELVIGVRVVRLERVPQELDAFLLFRALEGERQVVAKLGGFLHQLALRAEQFTNINLIGESLHKAKMIGDLGWVFLDGLAYPTEV